MYVILKQYQILCNATQLLVRQIHFEWTKQRMKIKTETKTHEQESYRKREKRISNKYKVKRRVWCYYYLLLHRYILVCLFVYNAHLFFQNIRTHTTARQNKKMKHTLWVYAYNKGEISTKPINIIVFTSRFEINPPIWIQCIRTLRKQR